jgi:probable HAF family extracellular repeat protein
VAAVLLAAYPLAASAQGQQRQAQPLPDLGGGFGIAHDINESNVIAGEASNTANRTHAVMWTNAAIRDLGTLGGLDSSALGISNRGQVVGFSANATNDRTLAFIWDQGVMTALPPEFSFITVSEAFDVNDNGVAVGTSGGDAVVWQNGQIVRVLPGIGATPTRALRITGGGVIVGTGTNGFVTVGLVWFPDGSRINLGPLPGGNGQTFGEDINDSGFAAGSSSVASGIHAALWNNGVPRDLGTLIASPSASSQGHGLSASGLVVGEGTALDAGGNPTEHGLLWDYNRQIVDLRPLAGNSFSAAFAVNSGGVAVGESSSPSAPRAVFWRL